MQEPKTRLELKEYPYMLWIFGAGLMLLGAYLFTLPGTLLWSLAFIVLGFVLAFVLSSTTTITADRIRATLTIKRRGLVQSNVQEFSRSEIASFEVDTSHGYTSGRSGRAVYRLVMIKTSGEQIPLENVFSADERGREEKARLLREYLGISGTRGYEVFEKKKAAVLAPRDAEDEENSVTSGVHWKLETIHNETGDMIRWISPDVYLLGNFLFLAQKPMNSPSIFISGGLVEHLMQMLYQKMMSLYGFRPEETPGIENARAMQGLDERLEPYYASLTGDADAAKKVVNPWLVDALLRWAERHPLKKVQNIGEGQNGQLVVLFGPEKMILVLFGAGSTEMKEEIISLGVDLVKAQANRS